MKKRKGMEREGKGTVEGRRIIQVRKGEKKERYGMILNGR